ncbi:MAG: hypothetical protein WBM44_00715, partial [Waterburya sp.]
HHFDYNACLLFFPWKKFWFHFSISSRFDYDFRGTSSVGLMNVGSKTIIDQDLQLNRIGLYIFEQMTLQELQKQALQLSSGDRWQLVQVLLDSLKQESHPQLKRGNLSRLRGIAKISTTTKEVDPKEDY